MSSRYADGNVPNVNRNNDGNVNVNRYEPLNRNDNLRARREISRKLRIMLIHNPFCVI